ncbi:MAG: hypothetical protein BWY50_01927 [Spirochaetes bacterium ADurb.Bin315]|nr:MAG: hypothetical protein BWY50_01927 [Spirochaetes bacterium ADurb.Bin315]
MEAQNRPRFTVLKGFLLICVAENHEHVTGQTGAGLHHVGNVAFVGHWVEVRLVFSTELLMLGKVIVGSVVHPFQLLPPHREEVLDIVRVLGVERQLVLSVLVPAEVALPDSQPLVEREPLGFPILEPLIVRTGGAEPLHLHLFKLDGAEDEVPSGDFVAERFSHLGDSEGDLHPGG